MATKILAYVGLSLAFVVSFILIAYYAIDVDEDPILNDDGTSPVHTWQASDFTGKKSPAPLFNTADSQDCRDTIQYNYDFATRSYDSKISMAEKLSASYQGILDKQELYSVELANNESFKEWTKSGWVDNGEPEPTWSTQMDTAFKTNLRTETDLTTAVGYELYSWRV